MCFAFLRAGRWRVLWLLFVLGCTSGWGQVFAPTIHTVSVDDGDALRPGSAFVLRFSASGGSRPLARVAFEYATSTGFRRSLSTEQPASGVISTQVTGDWPAGEYRLQSVSLTSELGSSYFTPANSTFPSTNAPGALVPPGLSENLFLTRFVVSGTTPHVSPSLTGVSVSSDTVQAGGTVRIRPVVTAGSSAVVSVYLSYYDPKNKFVSQEIVAQSGGEAAFAVPREVVNGKFTLRSVSILDAAGQYTSYSRDFTRSTPSGNSRHTLQLSTGDVTVTGGVDDVAFPLLQTYTLRAPTVAVGGTLSVDYTLVTGSRLVKSVVFQFNGPVGVLRVTGTSSASSGTASLVVPAVTVSGRYTLERIEITDVGDYLRYYQSNSLHATSPNTSVGYHNYRFSDSAVTVSGGIAPIPVFTLEPRDATVEPGRSVELRVELGRPASAAFQWYQGLSGDTSKPVGNNSSTYTFWPSTAEHYWVRASNSYGSADSRAAFVTPRFASPLPVVTGEPRDISYHVGNSASINFSVVGPGPLTYVWYKDGVVIPDATGESLVLPLTSVAQSGTYYLEVTNASGTVRSHSAQVEVIERPRIVEQSRSRTVRVGERVTFNIEATGGALRYGWSTPGNGFSSGEGSTFTIPSVRLEHAGTFAVQVFNQAGRVDSDPIVLTVEDPDQPLPQFVNLPEIHYTSVGAPFGFTVWAVNGTRYSVEQPLPPGLRWTETERLLQGPLTQAGDHRVTLVASNQRGSTSKSIVIRVLPTRFGPIVLKAPASQQVHVDERVELAVEVVASTDSSAGYLQFQWRKDGVVIPSAQGPTLTLYAVRLGDAGAYTVSVNNYLGGTTTTPAVLTVLPTPAAPPAITVQPASQRVAPGSPVTLGVTISSLVPATYQWTRNGVDLPGATEPTLQLPSVEAAHTGDYRVVVTSRMGRTTSAVATVSLNTPALPRLANASVRSFSGLGDRTLIVGFSAGGGLPKSLLLRVVGPGLSRFDVKSTHVDPKMVLMRGGEMVDVNDEWVTSGNAYLVDAAQKRVGAFDLVDHRDSAMSLSLAPGTYSVLAKGAKPGSGTVLIEVYDADETFGRLNSKLTNISARSHVGRGADVLIAGFVVTGEGSSRVLLRGIGPGLRAFGVGDALSGSELQLYRGSTLVARNVDWSQASGAVAEVSRSVGAFALGEGSRDAALVASLEPGAYTVILSGQAGATGIGLIEVYQLP